MLILCDRAQRRGVDQVDSSSARGMSASNCSSLIRETQPDVLVMGWPLRGAGRPSFKPDEFEAFVAELEREGNLRVRGAAS